MMGADDRVLLANMHLPTARNAVSAAHLRRVNYWLFAGVRDFGARSRENVEGRQRLGREPGNIFRSFHVEEAIAGLFLRGREVGNRR